MNAPLRRHAGVCRSRRRGFTLIEVLAAMVLISVVLAVAMRGVSLSLAQAEHARHTSEAAALGEAELNELIVTGDYDTVGAAGDFGPDHPGYRWTLETASREFSCTEIVLNVIWTERGQEKSLPLSTLVSTTTTGFSDFTSDMGVTP